VSRPLKTVDRNILLALGWYYPEIHRGVARFARDHHWHLTADFDDPVPKHWKGDGILTLLGARQNLWRDLKHLKVPIVDLAESRPEIVLPRVTMDNAEIARMAADYFLNRGYRHFAFVQRWDLGVSRRRSSCFRERIATKGLPCNILSWQHDRKKQSDTRENRHEWLTRRLTELPNPLAVFARDSEAVEVIEACVSADIKVPEQVAVLGVDNTEFICDCLRVPLSSIDNRLEQVGYEGAALLERLICGENVPNLPIYITPAGVVERQSTDSIAVDHPKVAVALRFIQEHSSQPISMLDVLRYVGMSRSGLEKAFREYYVRPPMEQLRKVRIEKAKRMLRETDEAVQTIASLCGFHSSPSFCRTFALSTGMTAKQFRVQSVSASSR